MDKKKKKDKGSAAAEAGGAGGAGGAGSGFNPAGKGVFAAVMAMPDVPRGLPPEVELARTRIICGPDFNSNVRVAFG